MGFVMSIMHILAMGPQTFCNNPAAKFVFINFHIQKVYNVRTISVKLHLSS